MVTILSIILYITIIIFSFLCSLLLYNGIAIFYWLCKRMFDYTNTQYEYKKIMYYKKKFIAIPKILIVLGLIILFYKLPVSFEKIIGSEKLPSKIESISLLNSNKSEGLGLNKSITDKKEITNILNALSEHNYTRNLHKSRLVSVKSLEGKEFVSIAIKLVEDNELKVFTIADNGYISDAGTGQAYKVKTDNEKDFFNKFSEVLTEKIIKK